MQGYVQIIRRFGWTWVGLVVDDDDVGHRMARTIRSELEDTGVGCLAYVEFMRPNLSVLGRIVTVMKESTARVVILASRYLTFFMEAPGGVQSMLSSL